MSIGGIALWPFIILREKHKGTANGEIILNHERIHIRQQGEMLVVLFYLWYVIEMLFRMVQYRSYSRAYRNISFEREAYANQYNFLYLKDRGFWGWTKYL